jgi:hypothetical protein
MRLKNLAALAVLLVAPLVGSAQTISTVVGGGPNNVQARLASVGGPTGVAEDAAGNLYFLDNDHSLLFKVTPAGTLTIIAGNGTSGYSGDGGPATSAQLNQPTNFCLDAAGNIFIADSDNELVREVAAVTANGMTAGNIYTVAGMAGQSGFANDTGVATMAQLNTPDGVFVDAAGNLFIADRFNYAIREVAGPTPASGMLTGHIYTIAGTLNVPGPLTSGVPATSAHLNDPYDVFLDSAGNIFIADSANNAIREIAAVTAGGKTAGDIYTVAGTGVAGSTGDLGPATSALLNAPHALFVDASENIFICDINNQVIREVAGVTGTSFGQSMTAGDIYTIAGTIGAHGYAGDNGPATSAQLSFPAGVYQDATGNILIADNNSDAVREVAAVTGTYFGQSITADNIDTVAGNAHFSFSGDGGPATNAVIGIPAGLSTDAAGDLFVADESFTSVIREVLAAAPHNIQTVVGEPDNGGYVNGALASGLINQPFGVFVDHSGNLFIADTVNNAIREVPAVSGNGMVVGNIYTIAGTGTAGTNGDMGLATGAELNAPEGVAVDQAGNVFIADTGNSAIREIPVATANGMTAGHLYTIAGTLNTPGSTGQSGPASQVLLNHPSSVFVDLSNNIYVVDTGNDIVLEIPSTTIGLMTAGNIYRVAGTVATPGYSGNTGSAINAELNAPFGIYVDGAGNLFISDTTNNVVRKVTASTGIISLVAGDNTAGFSGDGGPAISAEMIQPLGLAGGPAGNLLISDSGNGRVRSVTNLLNSAHLSATPSPLAFGSQAENTTSAALVLTLTNVGTSSLTVNNFTVGGTNAGDFAATSPAPTCTGAVLAATQTCTINVTFTPSTLTAETATITITDDANSPVVVTLTGTGALPTATPSPTSLAFGNQILNTTSPAQVVTITNSSAVTLTIASVAVTGGNAGDFAQTNTCSTPVPAAGTCTISVTFTPTASGARASAVVVTDNAADSPQSIALTGTGVTTAAVVVLNPTSLTFTSQNTGTTSAAKTVMLTNTGNATLNITSIAVGGANAGDFAQTNTCGTSVAAAGTCTISVTFSPTAAGARAASVLLTDNANGSPQSILLAGVGAVSAPTLSLSPTSLAFASQLTTTASAVKTVTLSNTGNSALTVSGITVTGANAGDFAQTNTCGTSVAAGANCVISVTFTPSASGARAAAISIADNATGSPQTVALAGNGVSIALTATTASATVTAGQTATYNLQLAATGGLSTDSFNVTVTCSGAPTLSTCTAPSAPVVVTPAAASTFKVTATTTAAGFLAPQPQSQFRMQPPASLRSLPLASLAVLFAILAMLTWMQNPANRARAVRVTLVLALVLLPVSAAIVASGCASAGSGSTTPPPSGGTPAGTYTLTVKAAVGGTSQTTKLTLIVQ